MFYIDLVGQKNGPEAIQRTYGVKNDQIRQWVKRYKLEGVDGLRHRFMNNYSAEFKQGSIWMDTLPTLNYAINTIFPILVPSISGYICILVVNNLPLGVQNQ